MKKDLGEYLKSLRVKSGMTQVEVSEAIGYTQVVLSQYESGSRSPSREAMEKLSELYKVSFSGMVVMSEGKQWRKRVLRELEGMTEGKLKQVYNFIADHIGVYGD